MNSAGISITIFILLITFGLFILPMVRRLSKNEFLNLVLKRGSWTIATYLMVLNSAIMATIAENAGYDLTSELFTYMFMFGVAGYLMMGLLLISTLYSLLKLWKVKKSNERYGLEDE